MGLIHTIGIALLTAVINVFSGVIGNDISDLKNSQQANSQKPGNGMYKKIINAALLCFY